MEQIKEDYNRFGGLSGSVLKTIAVITMFIDHLGAVYLERVMAAEGSFVDLQNPGRMDVLGWVYILMRLIGRLAFPIYAFLIVEGFSHTRNPWKYLGRLSLFALISEIPFDMAFRLTDAQVFSCTLVEFSYQNVFFTLAIGLLTITFMDMAEKYFLQGSPLKEAGVRERLLCLLLQLLAAASGMVLAEALHTDYGYMGVLAICILYLFRSRRELSFLLACVELTALNFTEFTTFFALIPIKRYNGTRGRGNKYFFYIFYPAHLLLLWGLCMFMGYMK